MQNIFIDTGQEFPFRFYLFFDISSPKTEKKTTIKNEMEFCQLIKLNPCRDVKILNNKK